MKYLLSLPLNAADNFSTLLKNRKGQWFCTSDPRDTRLGSGGGTAWLLEECYRNEDGQTSFEEWLAKEQRILIHAGGQSRRLPAYAVSGKINAPIPVFRWARGQRLSQDLLTVQLPLYEKIMKEAPQPLRTLIASGDVFIDVNGALPSIPEADVVCFGLWVDSSLATRHGVFSALRETPGVLDRMMQKPSIEELETRVRTHFFLMDIGLWLLSDRAVQLLRERSYGADKKPVFYDLYSHFGLALGENPPIKDDDINQLSVKIVPLPDARFHHYGTSRELISSTLALQEKVTDQRLVMHKKIKPNPAIFTQNSRINISFNESNRNVWIENSVIPEKWAIASDHVITGVPENDWDICIPSGICIDIVPVGEKGYAVRPYGIDDAFKGDIRHASTLWMGKPVSEWLQQRNLEITDLGGQASDLQKCKLFPYVSSEEEIEPVLKWMINEPGNDRGETIWRTSERFSADDLMDFAFLQRLYTQREKLREENFKALENNYERSVFYQLDLSDVAAEYARMGLTVPDTVKDSSDRMTRIHNSMLRSRIFSLTEDKNNAKKEEEAAFSLLRDGLVNALRHSKRTPSLNVHPDQIVWGRSPARIDIAGGWTDTPPFSLFTGGNVVNLAVELNGQPPLQVYVKPCQEHHILLRSIDLGAAETVTTFEELRDYKKIGSPFSIPKAALALCGFIPEFSENNFRTLKEQLQHIGSGVELTLLVAIPAGSGMGTSSLLASTVLGALNDFCGLQWDKADICSYTLVLEQLLTTGGGWQDQYGGVFHGIKLLQSEAGFEQKPRVNWLPDYLLTHPEYKPCHLLYYTGVTRVAKSILAEIVRGMFLNSAGHLQLLDEMKTHALDMAECIQRGDFTKYGQMISKTWEQKKAIDTGTNPPAVEQIISLVEPYCNGYKLPGAGGGGYLYMVAKDPMAAATIRKILLENPPNNRARFVEMELSTKGFQVSRS